MSKITALTIQEKNKNRCNLSLDGEFFRGVSLEVVYKYHLKVGKDIDQDKLDEIITVAEKEEAITKALSYISKYAKSKSQVKDYLIKKGYEEKIVWEVIDKLKSYGYVDDVVFSSRFIENTAKTQGQKLMSYKLMAKGVRKEDVEKALENTSIDFRENALALAIKHIKNKERTIENIQKTYRYLIGKGFSYEDAEYAISKLKEDR